MAAGAFRAGGRRAAAEHHRPGRAVEFRDRHHDRVLDRHQAAVGLAPLFERLELDRLGGEAGYVERRQHRLCGACVVVGRAADQREARQRDYRIDGRAAVAKEELLDRRPRIQATGEGRHDAQAARLQRLDHAIVVAGVVGERIRTQQYQADRAARRLRGPGQRLGFLGDAALEPRMVDADFGEVARRAAFSVPRKWRRGPSA